MTVFALHPPCARSDIWLIASDGPPNADVLRNAGVRDDQGTEAAWLPIHRLSEMVRTGIERGCMMAEGCPGVVFVGHDLRWLEPAPLFDWEALSGALVPQPAHARPLAPDALPTFDDGVRLNVNKVLVWARRSGTPDRLTPLAFHVPGGVFDDADLVGMNVDAWLPWGPASTLEPKPLQARAAGRRR